ncbi:pimeloyl-ACP methyl ester carboxylesterase [Kushneria sinocarnis]|uniref:Pimeloyl-ACP methyl ester carboxylesterase n=2 Tax=Kushneria sinocarnis TaxID=595502 RepID=A0A420X131_9GAMM|nr:pimeloyl-ACP methyl ester carboxylesterase [Kushneria sinocarnis]
MSTGRHCVSAGADYAQDSKTHSCTARTGPTESGAHMDRERFDDDRPRRPRYGRWLVAGTAAWMAWTSWQKHQALRARRSDSLTPTAPELSHSALVNDLVMRWEAHGDSDGDELPVIMIHGIPTGPRLWRHVIPHLVNGGSRCLAWEMVGYGWSIDEGLGRDISIPAQADYLAAWLQSQGIERAIFVGHDVGGGVVQALLAAHPEYCAGAVLVDSVAFDNWPVPAMQWGQRFNRLVATTPPALLRPGFMHCLAKYGHADEQRGQDAALLHWSPYNQATGPAGLANQLRHLDARDTLAVADRLSTTPDCPIGLIWGEHDLLDIAAGERLGQLLGAAPVRRIPDGYHFTPEDHPEIIADEINGIRQRALTPPEE